MLRFVFLKKEFKGRIKYLEDVIRVVIFIELKLVEMVVRLKEYVDEIVIKVIFNYFFLINLKNDKI